METRLLNLSNVIKLVIYQTNTGQTPRHLACLYKRCRPWLSNHNFRLTNPPLVQLRNINKYNVSDCTVLLPRSRCTVQWSLNLNDMAIVSKGCLEFSANELIPWHINLCTIYMDSQVSHTKHWCRTVRHQFTEI